MIRQTKAAIGTTNSICSKGINSSKTKLCCYRERMPGYLFCLRQVSYLMCSCFMKKIHSSHFGIESCTRKTKEVIFWPEMYKEIIEMQQWHVCAKCSRNQSKEPLQTPHIPNWPWSKLAIDQFSFNGMNYIVTVDYYSDYFEIDRLQVTTFLWNYQSFKKTFTCIRYT